MTDQPFVSVIVAAFYLGGLFFVCRYVFGPLTFPDVYKPPSDLVLGIAAWILALTAMGYAIWSRHG